MTSTGVRPAIATSCGEGSSLGDGIRFVHRDCAVVLSVPHPCSAVGYERVADRAPGPSAAGQPSPRAVIPGSAGPCAAGVAARKRARHP